MVVKKSQQKKPKNNRFQKRLKFQLKKRFTDLLIPEVPIAGISLEERAVKVCLFNKTPSRIKKILSFPLKPSLIEEGVLKKPHDLKIIVQALKNKLWPKGRPFIILSLPSSNFYINIFNLPMMEEKMLEEAIVFNLQTNSPLPLEEVYYDWEISEENEKGEVEVFSVLGIKKNIDQYLEIFKSSGFNVIAVEPYCLSVGRALSYLSLEFKENNFLVIDLRLEGIEFMLFEKGNLIYFDFDSWKEIFPLGIPKKIDISEIKNHLSKEIPPLLSYFPLKRNQNLHYFSFFSFNPSLLLPLSNFLKESYTLKEFKISISPIFPKPINESFLGVIGASLRGLIARSQDTIVSLTPIGTEDAYFYNKINRVISLWMKIFITLLSFLTVSLLVIDRFYLLKIQKDLERNSLTVEESVIYKKEREMVQKAEEFNKLVNDINTILGYQLKIKDILNHLLQKAEEFNIDIKKIMVSGYPSKNFTFQGLIDSKEKAFDFTNSLRDSSKFENISLPLSNITETQQGISFYLNGNFK
ncbi:MAG: type IV pilus biogenesis protein PilM [Candidatus Paceibacterota bacterium]